MEIGNRKTFNISHNKSKYNWLVKYKKLISVSYMDRKTPSDFIDRKCGYKMFINKNIIVEISKTIRTNYKLQND